NVRHDHVIANRHIVSDVRVSENMVLIAHLRHFALGGGAVYGHTFAESVFVANFCPGNSPLPFQVLGLQTDAGERKDLVPLSQPGVSIDDDMGMKLAPRAEDDMFADDAVWTDLTILAHLGFRMNNGGWMNCSHNSNHLGHHEGHLRLADDFALDFADTLGPTD